MTSDTKSIICGRYRHYRGNEYQVLGSARHSESEEQMVVYRCLYGDRSMWVRPLEMFLENIVVDGQPVPRFTLIDMEQEEGPCL